MTVHKSTLAAFAAVALLAACERTGIPPSPAIPSAAPAGADDGIETQSQATTISTSSILNMHPLPVCVEPQGTQYRAYFGYVSDEKSSKTVNVGTYNKFSPGNQKRGQPTKFDSGTHPRVFSVLWDGKPLTWLLKRGQVTASKTSPRCVQVLTCLDSPESCVLPVLRAADKNAVRGDDILDDLAVLAVTNPALTTALCNRFNLVMGKTDLGHQLLMLALIGETRNSQAETCLTNLYRLPYPTVASGPCATFDKPLAPGEICRMSLDQFNMGLVQSKAVAGLARQHTSTADKLVLDAVAHHPNFHVRSIGVRAYLWNKNNSSDARKKVLALLPAADKDLADIPAIAQVDTGADRDKKMSAYLKLHPTEHATKASLPAKCDGCATPATGSDAGAPPPERVCPPGYDTDDNGDCVPRIVE